MSTAVSRRWAGRLLATSLLLLAAGCSAALREPPSVEELSGGGREMSPERLQETRSRAAALFARRTIRAVGDAAMLWLKAAAADRDGTADWIGATRAYLWLADHLEDPELRSVAARSAVHTAQWCERTAPDDPACLYWLAAALGMQARERKTTALDALPRIVALLQRSAELDPLQDEAGPHRVLALLYLRAPGWPRGPGNPDKGLEHARKAIDLAPEHPPNLLALAEAQRAVEDRQASLRTFEQALDAAREAARRDEPDAPDWVREAERGLGRKTGK